MIERLFRVREAGSTPAREVLGGVTTFLTMAYIIFVNPFILSKGGMPYDGVVLATCLGAALGTFLMGFVANYPIALAPGMGMNAFFAFTVCGTAKIPWPTTLGIVFWSGILFLAITAAGVRQTVIRGIPRVLKLSAAAGIGLFIAFIGLKDGGIVAADPATFVTLGKLTSPAALLTLAGLGATLFLMAAKVKTAIFWGLVASTLLGLLAGHLPWPEKIVDLPRAALPGLSIDLWGALRPECLPFILVFLFFAVFDTMGTLMGVAHEAGLLEDGELPRIGRALAADATAVVAGTLIGTSTVTSYIESGTGVGVGARTGLANVVTGFLFILALFFVPLAAVVGRGIEGNLNPVTAPALIVVGTLMVRAVREIAWDDMTEAVPAFFTMILMPLTFNISNGLAAGIIAFVLVKLGARRTSEIPTLLYAIAATLVAGTLLLSR